MTQKMSANIIRLAGTVCCPGPITPLRKNRRLPGTITGKAGVRFLAGTVFADSSTGFKN
jgi:hypothetical protein